MSNSLDPDRTRQFCRAWSGSKLFAAVYPRLVEFLHFDIQSIGQKSHCFNTTVTGIAVLCFNLLIRKKLFKDQMCVLIFPQNMMFFTSLFNNLSLYWAFSIFSPQTMHKNSFVDGEKCILVKVLTGVTVLTFFIFTHPINWNYIRAPIM